MSVNMSLDAIISANKKSKGGRPMGKFRSEGNKKFGGGATIKRHSNKFSFSDSVPEGKWKHDKFQENNVTSVVQKSAGGPKGFPIQNNIKVTVNISNLGPSVISADLEELFEVYDVDSVAVHFNEHGVSLGSGSAVLKRNDAQKMLEDFKVVNLDGLPLKVTIVDDGTSNRQSIKDRLQFNKPISGRIQKTSRPSKLRKGAFEQKKKSQKHFLDRVVDDEKPSGVMRQKKAGLGGRKGKKEKKIQKTAEELDAELEEYMKKKE